MSAVGTNVTSSMSWDITLKKSTAASMGAFVTSVVVTPLDVAKVRLQTQAPATTKAFKCTRKFCTKACPFNKGFQPVAFPSNGALPKRVKISQSRALSCVSTACMKQPVQLTGTYHALKHIAHTEGLGGLWAGLHPTLLLSVPSTVCYFTMYDFLLCEGRQHLPSSMSSITPLLAGVSARIAAASVVSPLELVRTRMQSGGFVGKNFMQAFVNIYKTEGVASLGRGLGATLARDVPFSGIYWTCYEMMKTYLKEQQADMTNTQMSFVSGAVAGSIAATCTTPFDVVKTLQQVNVDEVNRLPKGLRIPMSERTLVGALKEIVRTKGLRGTMVGLVPRLARIAPGCAIMISSYELGKTSLGLQDN